MILSVALLSHRTMVVVTGPIRNNIFFTDHKNVPPVINSLVTEYESSHRDLFTDSA